MPVRKLPLVTGELYHIFNRGVARAPIYSVKTTYRRFVTCINYYRFQDPPMRLSYFLGLSKDEQQTILSRYSQEESVLVTIYCYCLMQNHFHILLKQELDTGITRFMRKVGDSYTRYFNTKTGRSGPLLEGVFKAVRMETDEQMRHLARYIHINPYVGHVIDRDELTSYPWSSLPEYLSPREPVFINKNAILAQFSSTEKYLKFLLDEADYKRTQQNIQHLILEEP
ncbi:transposase [Patescibacteria group bacterium]|nr:transposase [Patescibacteria group bacterium]